MGKIPQDWGVLKTNLVKVVRKQQCLRLSGVSILFPNDNRLKVFVVPKRLDSPSLEFRRPHSPDSLITFGWGSKKRFDFFGA
jgi:hypothetical protein